MDADGESSGTAAPLRSIQSSTGAAPPSRRRASLRHAVGDALDLEHLGRRRYAATGEHFIFNPQTGALQGTRKINRTIEVAQDGQSYATVARVTTFDPLGNVVATFVARASAERMQLEPIPDLP